MIRSVISTTVYHHTIWYWFQLRWDKYESKTAFWVEEDLEAEYESSKTKSVRENTQYEVSRAAEDTMVEAAAPVSLEMGEVRDAPTGWALCMGLAWSLCGFPEMEVPPKHIFKGGFPS